MTPTPATFTTRVCPICGSSDRRTVLELPATPLGDRYSKTPEEARALSTYPLQVSRCNSCGHCYVPILTKPDISCQHYLFGFSKNPGLPEAFREIAGDIAKRHSLGPNNQIVDIGANDGSWLSCFQSYGCKLLAVEPSEVPARLARERGMEVINDDFSEQSITASGLLTAPPRLISMNYMFANVPDPLKILSDIVAIADCETIISVLTGYHPAQLSVGMFDYVYHDHLSYYSGQDFLAMAKRNGLVVSYCREVPLKGGSLYVEMRLRSSSAAQSSIFSNLLKRESWIDQPADNPWVITDALIRDSRDCIKSSINEASQEGRKVIGYGAAHNTTTLLYALDIHLNIELIVDDNVAKHDRYSPVVPIPVKDPLEIRKYTNPLVIVLGWQHSPQIVASIKHLGHQCSILIPFPRIHLEKVS